MREIVTEIQETQRVPISVFWDCVAFGPKRNPKGPTTRHIIVKMVKFHEKERILKAARGKYAVIYKGAPIRLGADF